MGDPALLSLRAAQGAPPDAQSYIAVLKGGGASPAQIAAAHGKVYGFKARFVYSQALRGYAATLPEAALRGIAARPEVAFVSVDGTVQAPPAPYPGEDMLPVQRASFGVDPIDGDRSSTRSGDGRGVVNINVAKAQAQASGQVQTQADPQSQGSADSHLNARSEGGARTALTNDPEV